MLIRILALIVLSPSLFLGCQEAKTKQGRAFLTLIQAIDIKAPYQQRKFAVNALRELALDDDNLTRIREQCLRAHGALIESEELQANARRALGPSGSNGSNARVPEEKALAAITAIEQSNASLKRAMTDFPLCEREVRALAMRFRR